MQLMFANLGIVLHTEHRGGVLVHGALAQCGTWGVILAGPGGIGKTTASDRIRSPWRSLSDDATFVVRDTGGVYWAHPWPTWSRFIPGGAGGTWNVECPVPLHSIFFLSRSSDIRVSPVQGARAVCLLTESVEQASGMVFQNMSAQAVRTHRLQRFDNICALAKSVPCYILHLSLTGRFWEKIEEALAGDGT